MSNFSLHDISVLDDDQLRNGSWIVLTHATRRPPHLLLLAGGYTYALSIRGRETAEPVDKLLRYLHRNQIPSLFVRLHVPAETSSAQLRAIAQEAVDRYERVEAGRITCLAPIREVCALLFGAELKAANFIFELLPLLAAKNALGAAQQLYLRGALQNGSFELLTYTPDVIDQEIRARAGELQEE